ncbi:MAG: LTA synthase family protein [Clostridia bacterium]|nr:LTA synthase family protein [Clostridia bacterium]
MKTLNKKKVINTLMGIFLPYILIIMTEYIQKQSLSETVIWGFNHLGLLILNYLIIYIIFFAIQSIFNKTTISYLITALIFPIISLISHLKYEIRGEVLLVNDFALANKGTELLSFLEPSMFIKVPIILTLIFIISFLILIIKIKNKPSRKISLITFGILSIIGYFSFINDYTSHSILSIFGLDTDIRYNINSIHKENGVVLGLYTNLIMNKVQKPLDYSKDKVYEILNRIDNSNEKVSGEVKPNVIMIMSESFFDPTVLEGVQFSKDPIPNTRKLLEKYTSGKFISSTFAGGTSNIEFEAFTGNSIAYLPYGTVPYTDMQENIANIESLPKIMKNNGYKTFALHAYDKTFYNRDINYSNIGFEEFIGVDELWNPKYFGKYVSDETFMDNIIKIIEDNSISTNVNEPLFIWGVTMQNHTPYSVANYTDELEIQVSDGIVSEKAKDTLTAYVNGLNNSDKAIQKLIDYLEKNETPTILVFFGDHLPSLYDAYLDSGFIHTRDTTKWNSEEMLKLHTVPFFIYDNYKYKQEYSNDEIVGNVFLGNYLCNYIGLEKSMYFKYLDTLNFNAIRDRLFVDKNMNAFEKVTNEYKEIINDHKILQYDILYGEKYIDEYNKEKTKE